MFDRLKKVFKRKINWRRLFGIPQGFEHVSTDPHLLAMVWTKKQLDEQAEYFISFKNQVEYIVTSSLRCRKTGTVWSVLRPGRHHHVIRFMHDRGDGEFVHGAEQGFMTTKNRHITREVARALAIANGQVKEEDLQNPRHIFSEDLWETPEKYQYKPPKEKS